MSQLSLLLLPLSLANDLCPRLGPYFIPSLLYSSDNWYPSLCSGHLSSTFDATTSCLSKSWVSAFQYLVTHITASQSSEGAPIPCIAHTTFCSLFSLGLLGPTFAVLTFIFKAPTIWNFLFSLKGHAVESLYAFLLLFFYIPEIYFILPFSLTQPIGPLNFVSTLCSHWSSSTELIIFSLAFLPFA